MIHFDCIVISGLFWLRFDHRLSQAASIYISMAPEPTSQLEVEEAIPKSFQGPSYVAIRVVLTYSR